MDKTIQDNIESCVYRTAKSFYDDLCKTIASALSNAPHAEGDMIIPEVTTSACDLRKSLRYLINSKWTDEEQRPFHEMAIKKYEESPFIKRLNRSDIYEDVLEILSHESSGNRETYFEGPFWRGFWWHLTQLTQPDGIELIYRIDVQKGHKAGRSQYYPYRPIYEWEHDYYVDFGQYVKCVGADKHLWEQAARIRPVVSYRYSRMKSYY